MSLEIVVGGAVLLILAAVAPRAGWVMMLFVGVAQDAVRKIVPGQPSLLILPAAFIAVAIFAGMWLRGDLSRDPRVLGWRPGLRVPVVLFSVWVLVQAGMTIARTGNLPLAAVGALGYLLPILALQLSARVSGGVDGTLRWFHVYFGLTLIALVLPLFLSAVGVASPLFDQVRGADDTYVRGMGRVRLEPGLFRTAEIAGWHGAFAVSIGLYLLLPGPGRARRRGVLVLAMLALGAAILLSGRRKYVVSVVVVLIGFLFVDRVARAEARERLRATAVGALALLALAGTLWWAVGSEGAAAAGYRERFAYLAGHGTERVEGLILWNAVSSTVDRAGWLGFGAGAASQGGRFVGADIRAAGYATEGGVGKILAELGVPGLLLALWVLVAFVRHVLLDLRSLAARGDPRFALVAWASCVLAANILLFAIAKQVFGDPFILCLLGALAGLVLAAGAWAHEPETQQPPEARAPEAILVPVLGVRDGP